MATVRSGGNSRLQRSSRSGQRVWNEQPLGGLTRLDSSLTSTAHRRDRSRAGSGTGTAEICACVEGCRSWSMIVRASANSTIRVKLQGPLELTLRIRSRKWGGGRIQWKLAGQSDFPPAGQSVAYEVVPRDEALASVGIPTQKSVGGLLGGHRNRSPGRTFNTCTSLRRDVQLRICNGMLITIGTRSWLEMNMSKDRVTVFHWGAVLPVIGLALAVLGPLARLSAAPPTGPLGPIDQRFAAEADVGGEAAEAGGETPDFRRHVVPLLGRLGCNGRACHGSFQGQGGFRLSLFGYDFKADHENLVGGDHPRVDLTDTGASLMLRKPLEQEPHEGGRRLEPNSWQLAVLRRWIEEGAVGVTDQAMEFVRLEVAPSELVARKPGQTWQLRAIAVWADGSREDVTPLCRFQSNNDQVATINEHGLVTARSPGDSHVVAFYDNGVVPVPVLFPVSDKAGAHYPKIAAATEIDRLVLSKLATLGEVPSGLCSDGEFLRRVSLDLTGTLPTAAEARKFLADGRSDKRTRKIDELLERPGYAAWWATRFCDWTGNNARNQQNNGPDRQNVVSAAWYDWMRARLEENLPYDELVERIVLARSRLADESYADYCERMSGYLAKDSDSSFADQPYLPYYWSRRTFRTTEQRALGFAYTFLGVRIQCAQCHKHPFDQWTKNDFDRFENFFSRVRYVRPRQVPDARPVAASMMAALDIDPDLKGNRLDRQLATLAARGETVPFGETVVLPPPQSVDPDKLARLKERATTLKQKRRLEQLLSGRTATVLGGSEITLDEVDDPREILLAWMQNEANPYFAQAIVNRIWSCYFNVGIVEPPDDLSLANPPSNGPLLEFLASNFRERGYDLKWLHREICTSDTYQRGWEPNETNRLDERNFARAVPRRLPAEVAYDAIRVATAGSAEASRLCQVDAKRAIADPIVSLRSRNYALTVFGRSIRESNCDCDRSPEPSLLQTVFLQNDAEMLSMIDRRNSWLAEATTAGLEPQALVEEAYLRTLTRQPTVAEQARSLAHLEAAASLREGMRDLLWALLNTKEFIVNH